MKNKILILAAIGVLLLRSPHLLAQEGGSGGSIFDDSLQDIYVVLGAGAGGAILGLSTLSFVEKPKDHFKNVAIGGALGIVIGVGIVIFNQATKSQSSISAARLPNSLLEEQSLKMTPEAVESFSRFDFSQQKIAAKNYDDPVLGFSFGF